MKDTFQKALRRGHNEGNIRQRTDGRWEVRLSAGIDYKTGKRREMDKMDDMFGMQYSISVENQPYPVLCTLSADGCTAHVPDFPKIEVQTPTLDAALLEVKQQIQKALRQYKNPPIPTKQEQIVVPNNSVLVLVKAG